MISTDRIEVYVSIFLMKCYDYTRNQNVVMGHLRLWELMYTPK